MGAKGASEKNQLLWSRWRPEIGPQDEKTQTGNIAAATPIAATLVEPLKKDHLPFLNYPQPSWNRRQKDVGK